MTAHEPDNEPDEGGEHKATREQMRDVAAAYGQLAEELAKGTPAVLPNPPFDGELRQGVLDARRFAKSAKQRQIRRLAQLLRESGSVEEIRQSLEGRTPQLVAARAQEGVNEQWRSRMLSEGDSALAEFIDTYPRADRARLRQLLRQAKKPVPEGRPNKASTKLLREIRQARADGEHTLAPE